MRRWDLSIELDPSREQPVFLQLARAIADDIRRGRLKPGEALPGTRELAGSLRVNRNTVVAGYGELVAEGLLQTRIGGGTFVAESAVAPTPRPAESPPARDDRPTYALAPIAAPLAPVPTPAPGTLVMSLGLPDARLFPARALARAFRRAIERRGRSFARSGANGHPRLREELARMLASTRGLSAAADNLMVTRSIEQAIDLVARVLVRPGDAVAIEAFGYPPAWSVLQLAGARLCPVPLDDDGLDVDALERLLAKQPLRAVFLTPHHQFPTASVMSPARRARLAALALAHRFAVIEDDYDHEFHYDGKPVLPIASGAGRANVIYVGSLANLLAPGIHSAFVTAPAPLFERLAALRAASDARSDSAIEGALAELFEDGELLRHMRRVRRLYAARRDALAAALQHRLGSALAFRVPAGGLGLWTRADDGIDVEAWALAGEREGVQFFGARRYDFLRREQPFLRLGFGCHDETELDEAVRRMARALAQARAGRTRLGAPAIRATAAASWRPASTRP